MIKLVKKHILLILALIIALCFAGHRETMAGTSNMLVGVVLISTVLLSYLVGRILSLNMLRHIPIKVWAIAMIIAAVLCVLTGGRVSLKTVGMLWQLSVVFEFVMVLFLATVGGRYVIQSPNPKELAYIKQGGKLMLIAFIVATFINIARSIWSLYTGQMDVIVCLLDMGMGLLSLASVCYLVNRMEQTKDGFSGICILGVILFGCIRIASGEVWSAMHILHFILIAMVLRDLDKSVENVVVHRKKEKRL